MLEQTEKEKLFTSSVTASFCWLYLMHLCSFTDRFLLAAFSLLLEDRYNLPHPLLATNWLLIYIPVENYNASIEGQWP